MGLIRRLAVFAFAVHLLAGCEGSVKLGYFEKDRASAIARVQDFRKLYGERNYDGIYELGAPALKNAVSREAFVAAANAATIEHGKYKDSQLVGSSCFPHEVRLVYRTTYEKGEVTEMFTWVVPQDSAQLVMYKVSPGYTEVQKEGQVGCPT